MLERCAAQAAEPGDLERSCAYCKSVTCRLIHFFSDWESSPSSISRCSANASSHHFCSDYRGCFDYGRWAGAPDGSPRFHFQSPLIAHRIWFLGPIKTRFPIRQLTPNFSGVALEFQHRIGRLKPDHGVAGHNRDGGRRLVHRQNRSSRESILRLSAFDFRRRHRRICVARSLFLLRLPRARAHSYFSAHRNLGQRQS